MRIEFHPEADIEFALQVEYYDDQQSGLGVRFYGDVISHLEWVAANSTLPRIRKNYRRVNLKVFPFYIAYVIEGDSIWILAIAHANKKPGYWKNRK